ncbi:transketolase C-terminal domain-containing protein [Propionimicrobium sp. PCR01-08-3]|uniref:transketolase family protein n=1 Tax=Propionimicrobium sp. PCR01-08-3 TaxID=3052086 RepID=UPI00255D06DB|nr:transketolase C-terminal domain-containing protein [Propionimicrobium sp. PCR01-08-3]WIY83762.1 transketolase C-terminal domain-containing protein [Propionimicrobium sp. PCR01-08-3]
MSGMTDPRKEFGRAVTALAAENERIVVLSADSGKSSGFGDFAQQHPERYFEFGIMEQGVTGIASGLASTGKIPVFAAIAPFVTARSYEMVRNDLGYMGENAKIVGRNGGFTYSDLGATHQSLEDYAIMRMIPGLVVFAPSDPGEIRSCAAAMIEHVGPTYMRIGAQALPDLFDEEPVVIGKGRHLQKGSDVTIITTGYESVQTVEAVKQLTAAGISVDLIGMPTPSHLDAELICASAACTGAVVTVEEHYDTGGMGGAVAELLGREQPTRWLPIGVPHAYQPVGPYDGLLANAGIDAASITSRVSEFLGR